MRINRLNVWILTAIMTALYGYSLYAATGCTLNDPDRDVKRLFPQSTGYRTEFIMIKERGGETTVREIEQKLDDKLDPTYESMEVPYAYYTVLKGTKPIGRIHGINQKGIFGGMQLILATDLDGTITGFFYQKLSSPDAKKFRDKTFTRKFVGLTLADFYVHTIEPGSKDDVISGIPSPSETYSDDFDSTIRGIMKNLIQLDIFHLDRSFDTIYKQLKGGK